MTKNKRLKPEYAEALLIYATTTEPLKSITDRLGLRYNTVGSYIRNHYPNIIARHKELRLRDEEGFAEGLNMLQSTSLSPSQVMRKLGYGKRFIHFIQASHPEFLHRKAFRNIPKNRPEKMAKYAEAVALLTEMKKQQYNVVRKVAEETGLNYHALRLHVYTYHRDLIGLDPSKNKGECSPRSAAKYASAVTLLAAEPKLPENLIRHVAEKLGLGYHALRWYIYNHHPELAKRRRKG